MYETSQDKDVACSSNCVFCEPNDEDSLHLFLKCSSSCNVWRMCTTSKIKSKMFRVLFASYWYNVLKTEPVIDPIRILGP